MMPSTERTRAMQTGEAKAKRYRERAEQLRNICEDVRSVADRRTLRDVAKDYDEAAALLEPKRKATKRD
jgi:hypothetical protein